MLEQFAKDCIPWEGPHIGVAEQCGKEREAENKYYGPSFPIFLCNLGERQKERQKEGAFRFGLFLILILCY